VTGVQTCALPIYLFSQTRIGITGKPKSWRDPQTEIRIQNQFGSLAGEQDRVDGDEDAWKNSHFEARGCGQSLSPGISQLS
jgi:hypothetical protein